MSALDRPDGQSDARGLVEAIGLLAGGPVRWGEPVPSGKPGVYVVALQHCLAAAPIDLTLVQAWLDHVRGLQMDGRRPRAEELAERLQRFWHPSETVLYIGQTTNNTIGKRVGAFDKHVLGNRRPHRGGHWLKALRSDAGLQVWWAETDDPGRGEGRLLAEFRTWLLRRRPDLVGQGPAELLPFANLKTGEGKRKPHGITRSVQ